MLIALGQINVTVGDLAGNADKIIAYARDSARTGARLFVTPELALTGYPPQDLLFKRHFVSDQLRSLTEKVVPALGIPSLVGFVDRDGDGNLYNAAAFVQGGKLVSVVRKTLLPTYDVFDEWRYFKPAGTNRPIDVAGTKIGVTICEDIWDDGYETPVVPALVSEGARIIINLSSSPFHVGKREDRIALLRRHATAHRIPVLYCNLVGGEDELIFDGESMAVDGAGRLVALGPQFAEALVLVKAGDDTGKESEIAAPQLNFEREVLAALTLGIGDYFTKCGFKKAVIGLSGGIDSALTGCLAVEALGPAQVIGVAMPSRYTADMSTDDARALADNLGIEFHVVPIESSIEIARKRFTGEFGAYNDPVTVENLQARERGKILMEVSNDRRALVLATGNKTEYALGYSTLYGDMCGGLAVIGDVSKPEVYVLSRYYNETRGKDVIPRRSIDRAPSAELRENQVDPFDYDSISPLADAVVEEHLAPEDLLQMGYKKEDVEMVCRLVRLNEYKRRQAPPILRITKKAFGIGRKMPIVNKYPY